MEKNEAYNKMYKISCGMSAATILIGIGLALAGLFNHITWMTFSGIVLATSSIAILCSNIEKIRKNNK